MKSFVTKRQQRKGSDKVSKSEIFNVIMALYAGEDQNEVFSQLNALADRYPDEIEFYVPQLCTYLFHFSREDEND